MSKNKRKHVDCLSRSGQVTRNIYSQRYTNGPVPAPPAIGPAPAPPANGPVPAPPAMNTSYYGNRYPCTYPPAYANNFSYPYGANIGANTNSMNYNVNPYMNVPPGYNPSSTNGTQGSFPNGYVHPPYGASYPGCPPFPNSTVQQPYSNYQAANFAYPPADFSVPPPPIPHSSNAGYSKFPTNSRQNVQKQNMPFHCESCDRDFPTEAKQKQHMSEHIVCGIEGCNFSAHSKIVEKHISFQHRTGLFDRIVKGNSPEEVSKWIADRKRQFPTQQRIEQKQAQREEMNKRGERYSEPRKTFNNRFSNDNRRHNGSNRFDNSRRVPMNKRINGNASDTNSQDQSNTKSRPRKRNDVLVKDDENDDDRFIRKLAPFRGTAYHLNADDETDSASKDDSCRDSVPQETQLNICDSNAESNDVTSCTTSPAPSEISPKVTNSSPLHCDTDNYECDIRCPSPVQNTDESSVLESSCLDVSSNPIDFFGINQDCESTADDFANSPEVHEEEKKEIDVSLVNSSPDCSVTASSSMPAMSTSLDLLKAYDFSDDEEADEIVETTKTSAEVAPKTTESSDSEPEECSSKICPPVERIVSDEKIVPAESVANAEESDSKKSRKRKRHKDNENSEELKEKKSKEAEREKSNVPDLLMNQHKRNRRPTLLEKLLATEIKHERNVILQCVRYVVQNNYFDVGQTK